MSVHFDAHSPAIRDYYTRRAEIAQQGATKETSIRDAFAHLLQVTGKANGMTLVLEQRVEGIKRIVLPDGTLRDTATSLPRGYWEAKDAKDILEIEIEKKFKREYPRSNIIFEDTRRAILYQNKQRVGEYILEDPAQLALLLNTFYSYTEPAIENFKQAVEKFKIDTPDLAKGLQAKISESHKTNENFKAAFETFMEQCRRDLNPRITQAQVDDMLIQHLMTERLIRSLFQSDFAKRNIIAAEVEKVITALNSKSFDPKEFLGTLDYFYRAIESAATTLTDFAEKQTFLNSIYEQFFQHYSYKTADTHGIVYTPQQIVEFMVALVEDALHREFGYGLDHPHVCLIDPCTGTGNFIVQLLRRMALRSFDPNDILSFYRDRLFANEIMLLPYYLASLNIEATYRDLTGDYRPFDGLCFVDTLDLAEKRQKELMFITEKNASRVERQQRAPITVIIGNPPYNVGQQSENDNNKNRTYAEVERRVRETYAKDSKATNKNALDDPYVKFFRWASDRLGDRDGIVCFVTNNSFVDQIAFDGMRKHLLKDFTHVYHLDLHGNVRQNPKLSGTSHNVFGIQVGAGITLAIRSKKHEQRGLTYHRVPEMWRREEKLGLLTQLTSPKIGETWQQAPQSLIVPDTRYTWRIPENADEFDTFIPLGTKDAKKLRGAEPEVLFKTYSSGLKTNRDDVVYDFDRDDLVKRVQSFVEDYNAEVDRYRRAGRPKEVDSFIKYDQVKWSEGLKAYLLRGRYAEFNESHVRTSLYRPFSKRYLYFDAVLNERRYQQHIIFPTPLTEQENRAISLSGLGHDKFSCLMVNQIPHLKCPESGNGGNQSFPFYTYDEEGNHRRENITDWALKQFQTHYSDKNISKWDIFYYVYAALHSPAYRTKFAANLKRDLPRIPFYPSPSPSPLRREGGATSEEGGFWHYAQAGKRLADLHVGYESVTPHELKKDYDRGPRIVDGAGRTKTMKFTKDKTGIIVNDRLTVTGIPAAAHEYVLGSRSALAWIVDQYPAPDPSPNPSPLRGEGSSAAMVDLIGRVTAVSVATVAIVKGL